MHQLTQVIRTLSDIRFSKEKLIWIPIIAIIVSIALTLIAIFSLSSWAEISGLHHAVQHILIFGSGVGVGTSLLSSISIKTKKGSQSES